MAKMDFFSENGNEMDYVNAVETLIEYKIKRRNGRKGKSVQ
jgi:NADH:ubiquinone oxidoreductase subunit D